MSSKKIRISKNTLISMVGILIAVISIICMLSTSVSWLSFIAKGIVLIFGFVGFWVLFPILFFMGIYIMIKGKVMRFRFDISFAGLFVIFFAVCILTSQFGAVGNKYIDNGLETIIDNKEYFLTYANSITVFQAIIDPYLTNSQEIIKLTYNTTFGGGYFGYIFAGLFNSAFTFIGANVVTWIIIVIGLVLIFNRAVKKLFLTIFKKNKKSETKETKTKETIDTIETKEEEYFSPTSNDIIHEEILYSEEDALEDNLNESLIPLTKEEADRYNSLHYNEAHALKKAHFDFGFASSNIEPASAPAILENDNVTSENSIPFIEETNVNQNNFVSDSGAQTDFARDDSFSQTNDEQKVNYGPAFLQNTTNSQPATPAVETEVSQAVSNSEPSIKAEVKFVDRPQPKARPRLQYSFPPLDLLDSPSLDDDVLLNEQACEERTQLINRVFENLRVGAHVVNHTIGPSVTRFEIETNPDVSVSSISKYIKDISIRLSGIPVRFEPIIAGKVTSGLEIPNTKRTTVTIKESLEKMPNGEKYLCEIPFGMNITGELIHANLKDFPHMLVAGTTGSGKSVFVHSMIMTLIMRNRPEDLKLLLIDPKKVEFVTYDKIAHLLCPPVSEPVKANVALNKLVDEMERRYNLFMNNHARDIKSFNVYARQHGLEPLPYIVVFVDEYADLMEMCKDIRTPIVRIAQKARSAGIHLVIATQRPSVNVIDGVIKSNLSTHVALMVSSTTDSIVIIGEAGAETLLGNGDMLIECPVLSRNTKVRVQGCFVEPLTEGERVCDFIRKQMPPQYVPEFMDLEDHSNDIKDSPSVFSDATKVEKNMQEEELYKIIKEDIQSREYCSISLLTRTYGIGFPKAGRLFQKLINDGYVAPGGGDSHGSKVLIHSATQNLQGIGSVEQASFTPNPNYQNEASNEETYEDNVADGETNYNDEN